MYRFHLGTLVCVGLGVDKEWEDRNLALSPRQDTGVVPMNSLQDGYLNKTDPVLMDGAGLKKLDPSPLELWAVNSCWAKGKHSPQWCGHC